MLEKPLQDVVDSNKDLLKIMEEYGKVVKDILRNPNWEADLQKVKAKALGHVTLARARITLLQQAIEKATNTSAAGAKEYMDKLITISSAIERLALTIVSVEKIYLDKAVVAT